jgi:general nucleoside transport system ATP-binding protein
VKLELKGITKRYGSLVANDHIDLTVEQGQIHALLGENGAGKTTLMNVLYGLAQPDEGEILIDGQPQHLGSPGDAIRAGIGMVHQHFMLVPVFTVAENVTLGMERTRVLGLIDRRRTRRDVRELSERYGLEVNPDALVEDLPVGVQQRVEIVKALLREASVLILDEPTSVLTPLETEELFRIMRDLRAGGRSLVFISHKLKEVQEIADTITVIRRGRVVGERPPTTSDAELASLMVGRSVQLRVTKPPASPGDVRLDVQGLTVMSEQGKSALDEVSFEVRAGEILGVAGVQGNGQTELCEALLGLVPAAAGSVRLEGRDLTHATPRQRLHSGIGYIPEDRQEDGLVAGFSVADNLILDVYNEPPYSSGIALGLGTINRTAAERVADFDIRTTSTATPVGTLSGGNQQKVILAREIGREVRLLVASQPTRGLDVGSIEFVHRRIVEQRDQGLGVLLISSELDEIYALSDRIAVMYEGKITGFRDPDVPAEELGMLMAGATDADAAASGAGEGHGHGAGGEAAEGTGLMEAGLLGVGLPGAAGDGRGPADGGPPAGDGPDGDGSASGGSGSGPADDSGAEPE